MKKLIIFLGFVIAFLNIDLAFADNSEGLIYEKYKKIGKKALYNIDKEHYIPKEYKDDINALEQIEYLAKKTNKPYEIALAYENGDYKYCDYANNLDDAISKAKLLDEKHINEIGTVIDRHGQVVYATNAMGRVIKYKYGEVYTKNDINTNIYANSTGSSTKTYINHGYVDDVPIIDDNGKRAKIEVSGVTGWINKDTELNEYDLIIVPMNQVKNPSYYQVSNGELIHFISSDITSRSLNGYSIKIGPAPNYLEDGKKYYSYDGNYFYDDLNTLINDAKNNNHKNAVNINMYYNYYMYLPIRSTSGYTANEIDTYINNNTIETSKLRNTGKYFMQAQEKYSINALTLLGIAMNESAKGTSNIAMSKNNLFGINAVDSSPGQSANYFSTVGQCILQFAEQYMSRGYCDPNDWRYEGGNLGNKLLGANVRYASDPFWGEKATKYIYEVDKYLSSNIEKLNDFDKYQLGIYTSYNEVRNENRELLYKINSSKSSYSGQIGHTMIVLSSEKLYGENYDWINVKVDRNTKVEVNNKNDEFFGIYDNTISTYIRENGVKYINKGRDIEDGKFGVEYVGHVEGIGWQRWKANGQLSGTEGQFKRLEGLEIKLKNAPKGSSITYRGHVEGIGWMPWVKDGELVGTIEQAKRLEAIEIKLENAPGYSVEYRTHVEGIGWMPWVKDGELSGTIEEWKRIEAIEIKVVENKAVSEYNSDVDVEYVGHVEGIGWMPWVKNGQIAGTEEQYKRLEGLEIKLKNAPKGSSITYRGHVEGIGWMSWVKDGELVGTVEQSKRLEAIEIKLENAPGYSVEYRTHVEGIGWMPWVKDGQLSGTIEEWKRIEAIQIRIKNV